MKYSYGLIGEKLGHSYSKVIHEAMGYYDYELIPLSPDKLEPFLISHEFKGLNVTIPYKQAVIPYCAELSQAAQNIGSVNTIVSRSDGSLYGDNTDYYGFLYMADAAGINFSEQKVLVLGSGGTSLTACAAIRDRGGNPIVISRKGENNYDNLHLNYDAGVIVNTTPLGMYPNTDAAAVDLNKFSNCCGVIDVVYNPFRTRLIQQAQELGIPNAGGLSMLVAQAKRAGEIFTQQDIPDQIIESIRKKLQKDMINLTFVGMPGSGKTSVAEKIAKMLSRPFYDLDTLIEERAKKSIPEIFSECGEPGFRKIETEILEEYSKKSGGVISTGGGAVLSELNRKNLRQNSFVIHLKRNLQGLATGGRPLSKDLDTLTHMEEYRMPLYNSCADISIDNNGSLSDTIDSVMEEFYEIFSN